MASFLSLECIHSTIWLKPSNLASIFIALQPISPQYHFKCSGQTTHVTEQLLEHREIVRTVFMLIFCRLNALFHTGNLNLCAASWMWQCHPVICALTAAYFHHLPVHSIVQPYFAVCQLPKALSGNGNSSFWQLRDYWLHFRKRLLATQRHETERWDARQYVEHWAVENSEGIFWKMNSISPTTIIVSDILYTVNLAMC
jgi:hypothetical protein